MAFLYHTQHTHAHALLQSFVAVGVDHGHCQMAALFQKNASHRICIRALLIQKKTLFFERLLIAQIFLRTK